MGSLCPGPRPSRGHPGPGAVDKARDWEEHSQWPPCPWRGRTPARESAAVGQAGVGRVTQPGRLGSVAAPKPSVRAPISDTGATLPSWQRGAQGTRALPLKQAECLASLAGPRCSGPLPGESRCQGGHRGGEGCEPWGVRASRSRTRRGAHPAPERPEEAVCPHPDFGRGRPGGASGPGHRTSVRKATGFVAVCHSGHRTPRTEDEPRGSLHSARHGVWPGRGHTPAAWAARLEPRQEEPPPRGAFRAASACRTVTPRPGPGPPSLGRVPRTVVGPLAVLGAREGCSGQWGLGCRHGGGGAGLGSRVKAAASHPR